MAQIPKHATLASGALRLISTQLVVAARRPHQACTYQRRRDRTGISQSISGRRAVRLYNSAFHDCGRKKRSAAATTSKPSKTNAA